MKRLTIILLLSVVALSCEDEFEPCWTCSTELYRNNEPVETAYKSNLYCDMDADQAHYFERTNSNEYTAEGDHYRVEVRCFKLLGGR